MPTADPADHLVQVPPRGGCRPTLLQSPGDQGAELDCPAPDGLIADLDTALREQLLDIAKAEVEAEVESDRVTDHIAREAMAFEGKRFHETLSPISPLGGQEWRQVSVD